MVMTVILGSSWFSMGMRVIRGRSSGLLCVHFCLAGADGLCPWNVVKIPTARCPNSSRLFPRSCQESVQWKQPHLGVTRSWTTLLQAAGHRDIAVVPDLAKSRKPSKFSFKATFAATI